MPPSDAEIPALIRKVRAELFPALPPEIAMTAEGVAAVQIRAQMLRSRLDFPPAQEETSLPLTQLLALLLELLSHADALSRSLPDGEAASDALLQAMRDAVLDGEIPALREVLEQQRRALPVTDAPTR